VFDFAFRFLTPVSSDLTIRRRISFWEGRALVAGVVVVPAPEGVEWDVIVPWYEDDSCSATPFGAGKNCDEGECRIEVADGLLSGGAAGL
jgi:hypothetical protein